jgi:hypothetical protein
MTVSTLKIGKQEYVVVPRKDFDQLRRKADLLSDEDAADVTESIRRLNDPKEKRIPWSRVKKRAERARDLADIQLAEKRLADPNQRPIPYEQIRRELIH